MSDGAEGADGEGNVRDALPDVLPRVLQIGALTLNLFHREARVNDKRLGLHPREFELLWRLAETPGIIVTRWQLLREVWQLAHEPETNTVEVHVARLRGKLSAFGLSWMVETGLNGGYFLRTEGVPGVFIFGAE